jgi:hypothetical protein
MTLTTTQLLDFFAKIYKVDALLAVAKVTGGYNVTVHHDWEDDGVYPQSFFVDYKGATTLICSDYNFDTMNTLLDQHVKEQEERELKMQKRQELLNRLTDEEKELLGL